MSFVLSLNNAGVIINNQTLLSGINWEIKESENWIITGPTGSGKTLLANVIAGSKTLSTGKLVFTGGKTPRVSLVNFNQVRALKFSEQFYYQQRFNSTDADTGPEVAAFLGSDISMLENNDFIRAFGMKKLLAKRLLQLSNGENKKTLLAKALLQQPDILILDNPLVGLDKNSRAEFLTFIDHMVNAGQKVIFMGDSNEVPAAFHHIAVLDKGEMIYQGRKENLPDVQQPAVVPARSFYKTRLPEHENSYEDFKEAARLENIHVRYGDSVILHNVNWIIEKGDKWALRGPNGSGKSTLLSIITGDNPQAYANEVWLFDRKRGTGESIWEIKKKTGFMSPELQLYSDNRGNCFQVALSGYTDSFNSYMSPTVLQKSTTEAYFDAFDVAHLLHKPFYEISTGEQRVVLLVRALVKNPPLLILDEPCQGLDADKTRLFNEMTDYICEKEQKTLIYVSHYDTQIPGCIDKVKELT